MTTQLNNDSIQIETSKSKLCPYNNQYGKKYETKVNINIIIYSDGSSCESKEEINKNHNKAIDLLIEIIENYKKD